MQAGSMIEQSQVRGCLVSMDVKQHVYQRLL